MKKIVEELNKCIAAYPDLLWEPDVELVVGNGKEIKETKTGKSYNKKNDDPDKTMQPGIFSIRGDNSLQANSAIRYQRENFGLVK